MGAGPTVPLQGWHLPVAAILPSYPLSDWGLVLDPMTSSHPSPFSPRSRRQT